ncbi:hypothetical protein SERLA73DRAFT_162538 [Serpula lacrymans var. lacrymans S7.3]|uniref:Uncharacterized protein n=1 Tax=Serpula lacrymans var. lacrymans (strain S7.3) TaxID=936435 RepID=F8Q8D0_SERL3|nr:hypothetical protein SERLA73DRAFT_162538 [Serpula lacrymans var. lacrymans S7.3]
MHPYPALVVAWLFFTFLADTLVEAARYNRNTNSRSQISLENYEAGLPGPGDGVVERCVGGPAWSVYNKSPPEEFYPYNAETTFQLPVSYDLLYMITRGGTNIGSVNIVSSNVVKNTADVLVHVGYYTQQALDYANVCLLNKGMNTQGVGIYTPDNWIPSEQEGRMHFDVTVTFPATSDGKPLRINNFRTDFDHYSIKIDDIQKSVYFNFILLSTLTAGIRSDSIFAYTGSFTTTRAFIRGAFNVSQLSFGTTFGPIDVSVGHPVTGSDLTGLPLGGNNNPMQSTFSNDARATVESYSASAYTNDGPITVYYTNAPANSVQSFVAQTSGSPVTVSMSNAYEGSFSLDTTGDNPISVAERGGRDPSGQGRGRIVNVSAPSGMTHRDGEAHWDIVGPGWAGSSIQIRTDRAPIWLTV